VDTGIKGSTPRRCQEVDQQSMTVRSANTVGDFA